MTIKIKRKLKHDIDIAMAVVAVLHPLMALPQILDIYRQQSAEDVSLLTWVLFSLMGFVFLAYAIIHKIKPVIVTQILWFAMDIAIVTGIILYG